VAGVVLVATVRAFVPDWASPHRWESDQAQHVWWTARFADPGLFPGDFIADFFSLPIFAPLGWQAVMRAAVQVADPQRAAETLPLVLAPLLAWLCWRAGRAAGGGSVWAGAAAALASLAVHGDLAGGLPRAFAMPVLMLALVGLLERRWVLVGLAGLLAALFYPPVAVNLGLTTAVVLGVDVVRARRLPAGWPALAACGALALAVVAGAYATPVPDAVGPKLTGAEARVMAEFGPEGRSQLFRERALDTYLGSGRGGYGVAPAASLALVVLVALSLRAFPGLVPLPAWAVFGTGMLAHALAHATLFALHLPLKYMRYALPAFVILWLAALAGRAVARAQARWPDARVPHRLAAGAAAGALVWGVLALHATREALGAPHYTSRSHVYRFLAKLPKDALVVAHPEDADAIPLRTRRSVLASKEVALPYYRGYYERLSERLEASLRAHYAFDWETLDALHERYGADVILVHEHRFLPEARDFSEPFESRLGPLLHAPRKDYVLADPPPERLLYRNTDFRVVRLGPPRPGYESREARRSAREARRSAREARRRSSTSAPAAAGTR